MVEISEIKDHGSLLAWLYEQDDEQVSTLIGSRCALRILPVLWSTRYKHDAAYDRWDVARLRMCAVLLATTYRPSAELRKSADLVASDAESEAYNLTKASRDPAEGPPNPEYYIRASTAFAAIANALAAFGEPRENGVGAYIASVRGTPPSHPPCSALSVSYASRVAPADEIWANVRIDATRIVSGDRNLFEHPLWWGSIPLLAEWDARLAKPTIPLSCWAEIYEQLLAGRPPNWDMVTEIALIPDNDWGAGSERMNGLIAEILKRHQEEVSSPLASAAVADFSFVAMLRQMKAVGFDDDAAHLRDPATVQRFMDDIEEVRDGLTDFSDYAADARGATNAPAVLQTAADKMLAELRRTTDVGHLRARRIVTLGRQLEGFINEEEKLAEIGKTLSGILQDNVSLLNEICRKHFTPSMVVLQALDGLDLGDTDPSLIIKKLEAALAVIERADGASLVPLRFEDTVLLHDMIAELKTIDASIDEARTEKFQQSQRERFARSTGAVAATIGRYVEKASVLADDAGKKFDAGVKWYKRWETMSDLLGWLDMFNSGGGPPAS